MTIPPGYEMVVKDYIPSDFIMGDDSFIIEEEKIVLCINITPTNLKKLHKIKKRNKCTWNKVISILTKKN